MHFVIQSERSERVFVPFAHDDVRIELGETGTWNKVPVYHTIDVSPYNEKGHLLSRERMLKKAKRYAEGCVVFPTMA